MNSNIKTICFLCGARDFHAMDWYKSAKELIPNIKISVVTDLIAGEGFSKIVTANDTVYRLLILDSLLFRKQSSIGDKWRNLLKLVVLPVQVFLLKRFAKKNPDAVFHAHSMYYLVLASAAKIQYVGTPQGSDILVKPLKSKFYKKFAIYGLKNAKHLTVDSLSMKKGIKDLVDRDAYVIQNGINIDAINQIFLNYSTTTINRNLLLSIRGMTSLYRIKEIVLARNVSTLKLPLTFMYPFYEKDYRNEVFALSSEFDKDLGRVDREKMYANLIATKLVFSIPYSDSSPRSVYEAIFCGCAVVITHHPFYDYLPQCMKDRIIITTMEDRWFDRVLDEAKRIGKNPYLPSELALDLFDQKRSLRRMEKLLFD